MEPVCGVPYSPLHPGQRQRAGAPPDGVPLDASAANQGAPVEETGGKNAGFHLLQGNSLRGHFLQTIPAQDTMRGSLLGPQPLTSESWGQRGRGKAVPGKEGIRGGISVACGEG